MLGLAALAVTVTLLGTSAQARHGHGWTPPDPADVAARFTQHVERIAERTIMRNEAIAERSAAAIIELLLVDPDQAEVVAEHSINHINRSSDWSVRVIDRVCTFGTRILEMLEAEQALIDEFTTTCEEATLAVQDSQVAAVLLIEEALDPPV